MSIFKKRNKSKSGGEKDSKPQAAAEEPKPQPYRHIPQHAAADAVSNGNSNGNGDKQQIALANQHRMVTQKNDYGLANASYAQSIAHTAMHTTPSPSSHAGQQMQWNRFGAMQRNNSAEVFTTDPDAPPMPSTPRSTTPSAKMFNSAQRMGMPRSNSGYFPSVNTAPSFDSPMLGNPKMALAARDRGYVSNPHYSADSGYGSVGTSSTTNSRAPSEQNYPSDLTSSHINFERNNTSFLPELSLSEELAREPAFSEKSFADEPVETPTPKKKAPESVLKSSKSYTSQYEQDPRSIKSSKPKQARFEDTTGPANSQAQPESQSSQPAHGTYEQEPQHNFLQSEPRRDPQPESAATTSRSHIDDNLPESVAAAPQSTANEPSRPFAAPARQSTPPPSRPLELQAQSSAVPARLSSPPPVRSRELEDHVALIMRQSSPPPPQAPSSPLDPIVSAISYRSTMPSPSVLEGLKVNKKGKILDEEGEPIGELVEGNIIDCVRQKVNAHGEVMDDYGTVVGRVRALSRAVESPVMRSATPAIDMQQLQQQPYEQYQQYQQLISQHPQSASTVPVRRVSAVSQPEVFTPAWQQSRGPQRPVLAQELRDHLAAEPLVSPHAAEPSIHFNGIPAVELDASEPIEEALPLFDHSDVFVPPPFVPARSPLRTPSPTPPLNGEQHPRHSSSSHERHSYESRETARTTEHLSAPAAQRKWAAAELIAHEGLKPVVSSQTAPIHSNPPPQPSSRNTSDSGANDTSKSFGRITMSTVPEDHEATEPAQGPALYSYKGEIPAEAAPMPHARSTPIVVMGPKPPPSPSFHRQPSNRGSFEAANSTAPMNSAQFSSSDRLAPRRAQQFSTGVPGLKPQMNSRNSFNAPLRRSPLSSHGKLFPPLPSNCFPF